MSKLRMRNQKQLGKMIHNFLFTEYRLGNSVFGRTVDRYIQIAFVFCLYFIFLASVSNLGLHFIFYFVGNLMLYNFSSELPPLKLYSHDIFVKNWFSGHAIPATGSLHPPSHIAPSFRNRKRRVWLTIVPSDFSVSRCKGWEHFSDL